MSATNNFNIEQIRDELRNSYGPMGNFDKLIGAYKNANDSIIKGIDNDSFDILKNLHTDSENWIASSVSTLGAIMSLYDLEELSRSERASLGSLFAGLGELHTVLMDVAVVLDNTQAQLTKEAIAKAGASNKTKAQNPPK